MVSFSCSGRSGRVGGGESVRDLAQDAHRALAVQLFVANQVLERDAPDDPHGYVRAALHLPGLVHRDDVRMVDCRLSKGLAPKAREHVRVLTQRG
jgi:hypothetical protein